MPAPTPDERILAARERLAVTLDAIEERLNVPKRAKAAARRWKASFRENPAPWIAGAVGAAVAVAGAAALVAVLRRAGR